MTTCKRLGTALVMCAPSGAGKTTLAGKLIAEYGDIAFSISCTTRQPRGREEHGREYFFMSKEEFLRLRDENYFAEWAEVHGNYYGTPLAATMDLLKAGRDLLFDVDVQGAAQLRGTLPSAYFVVIMPPSLDVLESRLRLRGTDSEESIRLRLANAKSELREAWWFDDWVVNDDLEEAYCKLRSVYHEACEFQQRRYNFLQRMLERF